MYQKHAMANAARRTKCRASPYIQNPAQPPASTKIASLSCLLAPVGATQ